MVTDFNITMDNPLPIIWLKLKNEYNCPVVTVVLYFNLFSYIVSLDI